jgi:abortive infection bacteriophage resistance protein
MKPYDKPWLSVPDQLRKLKDYGLSIADEAGACAFLQHINYYRFSGYGLAFKDDQHSFRTGTTFDQVRDAYCFDRALRDLVTEALEIIELDLRATVAFIFGRNHQPFGHIDPANFFHKFNHAMWLDKLHDETDRSDELFIEHYKATYIEFPELPIWVATEIMSFGALSFMYSGMLRQDQKDIAFRYHVQSDTLQSWIHHLVYTRNLCAHHARIWDRKWAIAPDQPPGKDWQPPLLPNTARLFASLLVQGKLLYNCPAERQFTHEWRQRIEALIDAQTPAVPDAAARTGMPLDWKKHPLWSCL